LASTRRGFARKIVPNGVQLWRRLCSPLGVPPDDDDESPLTCVKTSKFFFHLIDIWLFIVRL